MSNTEQKQQKRDLEKTLANSLYALWEAHSLYESRKNGKLRVLLVGSGECLNLLRDKILANGQLLNTELEVVIVSKTAKEDGAKLMKTAPDLWRFIEITGASEMRKPEWALGSLHYQEGDPEEALVQAGSDFGYILVSTGDTRTNKRIAQSVASGEECTVAYVRDVIGAEKLISLNGGQEKNRNPGRFGSRRGLIESVAYNLHHAYERGNDPLATDDHIRETYWVSYNRESNIECALHIQSKLQCCEINTDDPKMAVMEYQKMLNDDHDGKLVEALARLEHQRWCISKMLQGFRVQKNMEMIYSKYKVATHSKEDHWHIALVPYGAPDKVRSRLCADDWIAADPDTIENLDELDRQTLRVHKRCGELARDTFRFCKDAVDQLRKLTDPETFAAELDALKRKLDELDKACYRVYRKTAVFDSLVYRDCDSYMGKLREKLPEKSDARELLDRIICRLGAWHEFVTRKDYKEQNRVLVRNIPFALSAWRNMTLIKLMSDDVDECINSVWQLSPTRAIFLDYVNSEEEMASITLRMRRIRRFLKLHGKDVEVEFRFYVSGTVRNYTAKYLKAMTECECKVQRVDSAKADAIRPRFVSMVSQCGADYIDLTGGKPELVGVAEEYARNSNVGAFVIRDNRIRAYEGAEGLDGLALDKTMTVEQMFDHSGARKVKQDDDHVSEEMKRVIPKFWEVARENSDVWHAFCFRYFSPAYLKMKDMKKRDQAWDRRSIEESCFAEIEKSMDQSKVLRFRAIRDQMENAQVLTKVGDVYAVKEPDILLALRNSGKVLEYYIYCTAAGRFTAQNVAMSWQFAHSWEDNASAQNEVDVICTRDTGSLFISAKFVSEDTINTNGFVNHVCYEVCEVADHFGLNAKKLLAAPNVPQYDKKTGELSRYVKHAMSRGVYLLGDVCFEKDRLGQVLENIAAGKQNWYEVEEKIPAGV